MYIQCIIYSMWVYDRVYTLHRQSLDVETDLFLWRPKTKHKLDIRSGEDYKKLHDHEQKCPDETSHESSTNKRFGQVQVRLIER